jgi:thiol-disulfide isomerase/thioredoxin
MDSGAPHKEDAVSKILLIVGLLLVVGAIAVYHFSPRFVPPQPSNGGAAAASGADQTVSPPAPAVSSIRGETAPAFELLNLDGKKVRLADFKGKVVLVNFWATWCGPCLLEIPWFIEFQKQYGPKGLEVVGISMDEEGPSVVKPFVAKHEMNYTVVMGKEDTPELFGGLPGYPVTFVVDRQGKFYSKHLGLVSKEDMEAEIQTLLKENSDGKSDTASSTGSNRGDTSRSTPHG